MKQIVNLDMRVDHSCKHIPTCASIEWCCRYDVLAILNGGFDYEWIWSGFVISDWVPHNLHLECWRVCDNCLQTKQVTAFCSSRNAAVIAI